MKALIDAVIAISKSVESRLSDRIQLLEQRAQAWDQRPAVPGPPGEKGLDGAVGPMGPSGERGEIGPPGPSGPRGDDGHDGAMGPEGPQGPPGVPGARGERGERGEPGVPGERGERGSSGEKGLDGKDGRDGRDGLPGTPGEKGLDGKDGRDGVDGVGFDDIDVEYDGERSFTLKFIRGDIERTFGSFRLPLMIYRGVYEHGKTYERGDVVTWANSTWVSLKDVSARPGTSEPESRGWQLMVRKGADGKAGPPGPKGETVIINKNDGKH